MPSHSFRDRLIAIFLVLAIAPLLLTAVLIGRQSYQTHLADTRDRQSLRAQNVASHLKSLLHEAEHEIHLAVRMANDVDVPATMRRGLERLLADRRAFREVAVFDQEGTEAFRLSNIRLPPPPAAGGRFAPQLLDSLATGESNVERIQFDATTGEPFMALSVPILSPRTGRLAAVVVAELRAREVWNLVTEQDVAAGESVYVIEESGLLIAHANPSRVLGGQRSQFQPGLTWQAGLDGNRVMAVGSSVRIGNRTFTAVVDRTWQSAVQPAVHALMLIGGVTLLTLGVAAILLVVAVRAVVRPLQAITTTAMAVRDGDYDRQVVVDNRDEIGQLADSFNSMTARMRSVLNDLRAEVEERRHAEAELVKVNKAYQALSAATALLDHADDERQILDEVCRIVINDCGYRLVWIGFLHDDDGGRVQIRPVAHAGLDDGYLAKLSIDLSDPVRRQGPSARSVLERRPAVVRDTQSDPTFAPWREDAHIRGFAAMASIPLLADGQVLGVLTVYADQAGAMSDEEIRLLDKLASNLAQGMTALRLRQDRIRAEQELRDSEARLRQVTDAIPALVWMIDENGISYLNRRFYEFTGLNDGEALGDEWQSCLHPDDRPKVTERWREVFASGGRFEIENRLRRADGTYRWFLVQGEPIVSADGTRVWFGTCIDIEDRKRSEMQLVQASKLATLGEMAASMAHELGQPLNIIRIVSDDAVDRAADGGSAPADQAKVFKLIGEQAARMGLIIEHMRVFSRDDNLKQEVFDVCAVLRSTADLMTAQMAAHGIALRSYLPSRPIHVLGNRLQLEQVIFNLIANARDAIEATGSSPLGSVQGLIELTAAEQGGMVTMTVADDGPGIPPDALPHIFEPFFTTKSSGKGTGLGLAISQRIAQRMGGQLEVGNPGTGAEFRLTLPVTTAPEETTVPATTPRPAAPAPNRSLLVVDDERMAAELLDDILARRGYDVRVAHDAAEATARFAERAPDLVITDITMPGGDGAALVARMRDSRPGLPVIFMTGRLDASSLLADELAAGRTRLFRKPVAIDEILPAIADLLAAAEADAQPVEG